MNSREMAIRFVELITNTHKDLEFDPNVSTSVIYQMLTKAQEEYIDNNILVGDTIQDQINSARLRSDVLRKLIKRSDLTPTTVNIDGGINASFDESDFKLFLSGVMRYDGLINNNTGSTKDVIELELINHYDLSKKIRTVNNEPVMTKIPFVIEGSGIVFYLSSEYDSAIGVDIADMEWEVIYVSHPPEITAQQNASLPESFHNEIVKLAVGIFVREYKFAISQNQSK